MFRKLGLTTQRCSNRVDFNNYILTRKQENTKPVSRDDYAIATVRAPSL